MGPCSKVGISALSFVPLTSIPVPPERVSHAVPHPKLTGLAQLITTLTCSLKRRVVVNIIPSGISGAHAEGATGTQTGLLISICFAE